MFPATLAVAPAEPETWAEAAAFVLALRSRVSDLAVLRAMETVPREVFAPRRYADLARQDVALPLPFGQTMTSPAVVAAMLGALAVRPGHRILEIGTGSGYVAALLSSMGAGLVSVERHPVLAASAAQRLRAARLDRGCTLLVGDGLADAFGEGRFDRIILNGGVACPPAHLTSRLVAGGRLVAGQAADGASTRLLIVSREADGRLVTRPGAPIRLARLAETDVPDAVRATEA